MHDMGYIVSQTISAAHENFEHRNFELLGYDFLIDENM